MAGFCAEYLSFLLNSEFIPTFTEQKGAVREMSYNHLLKLHVLLYTDNFVCLFFHALILILIVNHLTRNV